MSNFPNFTTLYLKFIYKYKFKFHCNENYGIVDLPQHSKI